MNPEKIYLAGKMTGLPSDEIKAVRNKVYSALCNNEFCFYPYSIVDPMRFFDPNNVTWQSDKEYILWQLSNVKDSKVIVVIWDKTQSSLGTMAEMTTAYNNGIPIILYNIDNIAREEIHPYVKHMANAIFSDLYEMVAYIGDYYFGGIR